MNKPKKNTRWYAGEEEKDKMEKEIMRVGVYRESEGSNADGGRCWSATDSRCEHGGKEPCRDDG
jgi:hypothetical protein